MSDLIKTDVAFEELRADILNGAFKPGQPLRMAALSVRYGVSATPLREALSRLAEKQMVVAAANRGWRVAPVSLAEFEDISIARLTVETALLEDAMARGGLDWESRIVGAHYHLAQTPPPLGPENTLANRQSWIAAHNAFHDALLAAARSCWLKDFYAQTVEQLQRHHQAVLFHTTEVQAGVLRAGQAQSLLHSALSIERHTRLMDPVLARDTDAARKELSAHIETTLVIYRAIVRAQQKTETPTERMY